MAGSSNKSMGEMTTLMTLAPLVIATRVTEFWTSVASPTAQSRREAGLMVTEKVQAMGESAVAMTMAGAQMYMEGALACATGLQLDLDRHADEILAAGLKPYASRVKANRRRLAHR